MRVVAVTGAAGFIGTHLCHALVAQGVRVHALVRGGVAPPGTVAFRVGDLRDGTVVRTAMEGVQVVFHLAARVHIVRDPASQPIHGYWRDNVDCTRVVLEAAAAAEAQAFVLASSVKAVGYGGEAAVTCKTTPAPCDPYGASKLEAERVTRAFAAERRLHAVILRFPLIYGPGMRGNMLRLFRLVWLGVPLPLGRVRNRRSLAYVGNAVAGLTRVVATRAAGDGSFFVADEEVLSTPELVRRIARALGRPARLVPVPLALFRVAGRLGDAIAPLVPMPLTSATVQRLMGSLTVDAAPLAALIGPPPFTFAAGLAATADWFLRGQA